MESFLATQLSVPLSQMLFLMVLTTTALLFGRIKLALLMNYLFALFWGYVHNGSLFDLQNITMFTTIYVTLGVFTAVLAAVGFLTHQSQS